MKEAISSLAEILKVDDVALLEQDVRLHRLLHHLTKESAVAEKMVFKGGTYLIKCHLNYPRFSVDLDFTWRRQEEWDGVGVNRLRDLTRPARNQWRDSMQLAAQRFGYAFDAEKIRWGSSSRMGTANFGYTNSYGERTIIKIQLNFVEPLEFEPMTVEATSLDTGVDTGIGRLYDDEDLKLYQRPYPVVGYDVREVVAEKCRAILTRRVPKGRDLLDLYLIERDLNVRMEDQMQAIENKLDFALGLGEKYRLNYTKASTLLDQLASEDIQPLLLKEIDHKEFNDYRTRVLHSLSTFIG